jgi:DUF1365 family protein
VVNGLSERIGYTSFTGSGRRRADGVKMKELSFLHGHVYHARSETAENSFRYPIFNVCFSIDDNEELKRVFAKRFFGLLSLSSKDYIDRSPMDLKKKLEDFAATKFSFVRGRNYDRVVLQTIPKMFGYVFNPVSFWYFFNGSGLTAVLCEVNNTFGEKHFYWLTEKSLNLNNRWLKAEKEFHVSPFFPVEGRYQFRFDVSGDKIGAYINFVSSDEKRRLITWIKGELKPVQEVSAAKLIWRYGWMTPLVVIRIHTQAAKLFMKKVKFFSKPELPDKVVTYGKMSAHEN